MECTLKSPSLSYVELKFSVFFCVFYLFCDTLESFKKFWSTSLVFRTLQFFPLRRKSFEFLSIDQLRPSFLPISEWIIFSPFLQRSEKFRWTCELFVFNYRFSENKLVLHGFFFYRYYQDGIYFVIGTELNAWEPLFLLEIKFPSAAHMLIKDWNQWDLMT